MYTFLSRALSRTRYRRVRTSSTLSNETQQYLLHENHIYITASINDSCPNHVIEGLLCGLPILYIDHNGGGKDLCELITDCKVGEKFISFVDLINNIHMIRKHYNSYKNNIIKNIELFENNICYNNYLEKIQQLI